MKRRSNEPSPEDEEIDLSYNVGHLIRRAQQRMMAIYAEEIGREISSPQFSLLLAIMQEPGRSQIDFVQKVGIDRSTLSAMVDRLVKNGMLVRERMHSDQRVDALFIAPKGAAMIRRSVPGAYNVHRRLMQLLPADLRPGFLKALIILAEQPTEQSKPKSRRKAAPPQEDGAK
ncbi:MULTISPECIES: MarR family transcriptional regulator [unclassified Beijerinckia]|uniref:MarR family winged helix-turn-helix transcriptional regulator n=1 Tax=unclassified Beijerinckia TaxID=2638183 RepID=UPI0008953E91|nr:MULTISPECIES: MarR family transcriptional regulator [unclassified Beijerinckia]MDH7795931.1 DNA-binding MarR family transcriptional regulator [Beijerinckia sp. GAS462]SEC22751.1 DNA-binding transcriptional regulator, MarR family [Beijerinckia sp. 28-YEA-48]